MAGGSWGSSQEQETRSRCTQCLTSWREEEVGWGSILVPFNLFSHFNFTHVAHCPNPSPLKTRAEKNNSPNPKKNLCWAAKKLHEIFIKNVIGILFVFLWRFFLYFCLILSPEFSILLIFQVKIGIISLFFCSCPTPQLYIILSMIFLPWCNFSPIAFSPLMPGTLKKTSTFKYTQMEN